MTEDTNPDWADRYLGYRLGDVSIVSAEYGVPPEAADYMDNLSSADLSYVPPRDREAHLEAAVGAVIDALESDDGVADREIHGRSVSAFVGESSVVALIDGLGEVLSVDRETAALLAFAYHLDPEATDEP